MAAALVAAEARAHDPSSYGGLFRSRDLGRIWLNADTGLFINAALAVAVDPRDPAHLLFGTDVGLLRSRSGGRSWKPEATDLVIGMVFAAAFSPDGRFAVVAAPSGIFRSSDQGWSRAEAPAGAAPARAIAFGGERGRVFLLGAGGLFVSRDEGASYIAARSAPPGGNVMTAMAVAARPREIVFAVAAGRLFASRDGTATWEEIQIGDAAGSVNAVAIDALVSERVWANAGDRIVASEDSGRTWQPVGAPLPEAGTAVRGIAADRLGRSIVVTTHRGMYRSEDAGAAWELKEGNLPVHLESGPLVRDPSDAASLYAVYSLIPFPEAWRTAVEGGNLLSRADPVGLAGGLAFLLLLLVVGALFVRWLAGRRSSAGGRAA